MWPLVEEVLPVIGTILLIALIAVGIALSSRR